ncbi:hypothetical protein CPC08DRAFT_767089 [Agrocybe pediades]|nr:hypothetical protein CPC08DRAFT_767089 [Agrocybe pediades]
MPHLRIDADRDVEHPPVLETDFARIDLPFLETLQIRERHASEVVALLECIKPSCHCGLLVTQRIPRMGRHLDPLTSYDLILKWILAYINGRPPNFIKLYTLNQLEYKNERFFRLAFSDCNMPAYSVHVEQSVLYVEVHLDARGLSFVQKLAASSSLFSAVERLHVNSLSAPNGLYSVYQDFPFVTALVIAPANTHYKSEMTPWYTRSEDGTPQPQREAALFPRLHTVILEKYFLLDNLE